MMISIITAIHNQYFINRFFYQYIKKYTRNKFELIIIDNNSTDGSKEFFQSNGAIVIENNGNYSYPYCQNQGIQAAKGDVLAFLNNDIVVSPDWDSHILKTMQVNQLDIVTACGIERVESIAATKALKRRWKMIKNLLHTLPFDRKYQFMFQLMYPNWQKFSANRNLHFQYQVCKGFVGNTVLMTRTALEAIGYFDERVQAADFDLCMRSIKRHEEVGDIKPVHIALDVFVHHFIRITMKSTPPPFKDIDRLIDFNEKWAGQSIPGEYFD